MFVRSFCTFLKYICHESDVDEIKKYYYFLLHPRTNAHCPFDVFFSVAPFLFYYY